MMLVGIAIGIAEVETARTAAMMNEARIVGVVLSVVIEAMEM